MEENNGKISVDPFAEFSADNQGAIGCAQGSSGLCKESGGADSCSEKNEQECVSSDCKEGGLKSCESASGCCGVEKCGACGATLIGGRSDSETDGEKTAVKDDYVEGCCGTPLKESSVEPNGKVNPSLQCIGLTKFYGRFPALQDVSFSVKPDSVCGLLGPNGSGKSTLIKLAMGMLQPSAGSILIDGKAPSPATKATTAYLPDANYLCEWMTVDRQVKYCADFFSDFNVLKAEGMLSRLGISGKQKIKALSKGNKEKLGLILTMARDAKLYILDEPIAGVDPAARDFIVDTVMNNRTKGSTVFLCTHLIADIQHILTHALFLDRGKVVLDGDAREMTQREGKTLDEMFRETFRW